MKSSSAVSAHCRSSKTSTTGALLGDPLEEEPPGGEEVLAVGRGPLAEAEQVREPRLDPGALVRVGDVLLERRAQLRERAARAPRPRRSAPASAPSRRAPRTRRPRRRRDSGRGATRRRRRARRCTSRTPRRAATCRCRRCRRPRRAAPCRSSRRGVEELLDEAQLAVAPDERRLERRSLSARRRGRRSRGARARAAAARPCP